MGSFYRRIKKILETDLKKKMVLLSGPRQCGKTTLGKDIVFGADIKASLSRSAYYNWDIDLDRKQLLRSELKPEAKLWVLDEIHKNRRWRNWLKGLYDAHHENHSILVTGSARLDLYSRGGDSLQGRYYPHRLHPWTLSELLELPFDPKSLNPGACLSNYCDFSEAPSKKRQTFLLDLLRLGGFPEPLFSASEVEANRWRLSYNTRLVREEVTSLEQVQDLARLELLFEHLTRTVGSVLSINSLREDLEVSFVTVKKWIYIFEKLYGVFRLYPFGSHLIKAVKKEAKLYFWDWAQVESEGARFENLVAVHLMRWVHWMQDVLGQKYELRYFRTTLGHEVDFVLLKNSKPWMAIEVKQDDRPLDSGIRYFLERTLVPSAFQISLFGKKDFLSPPLFGGQVRFLPAEKFLSLLP